MSEFACRELAWEEMFGNGEDRSFVEDQFCRGIKSKEESPNATYSRRASHIHSLREHLKWAHGFEDIPDARIRPPSRQAVTAAEEAIYNLPEDCLDFNLEISSYGEINFLFGRSNDPFQIIIEANGLASYYGVVLGAEVSGSDVPVAELPYMKLVVFMANAR